MVKQPMLMAGGVLVLLAAAGTEGAAGPQNSAW